MPGSIDRRRAVTNLMRLLAIEGPSGREGRVADAVETLARRAGCRPSWIARDDAHRRIGDGFETGNLIVRLPGTRRAPRRLFAGHMDTVPLCRGARPVRRGGRIVAAGETGLGGDNRTAVACLVTVIETLLERGLSHPPLTFLFTVGEETGLRGSSAVRLTDLGRPRLGFNVDGGDPRELWVGAIGAERWTVDVRGRSAHAGVHPEDGVSAALVAARAIAAASADGWFGAIRGNGRRGTANVGSIVGGEATNQVTDHVRVTGESRSHDPRFLRRITAAWRRAFERAARGVRSREGVRGRVEFHARTDYAAFELAPGEPVVRAASAALRGLGLCPHLRLADGGLDANALNARGVPTVTLGAGQHAPHTVDEYVEIDEYVTGCRLVLALAAG